MTDRHCAYCGKPASVVINARSKTESRAVQTCEHCRARGWRWTAAVGPPNAEEVETSEPTLF